MFLASFWMFFVSRFSMFLPSHRVSFQLRITVTLFIYSVTCTSKNRMRLQLQFTSHCTSGSILDLNIIKHTSFLFLVISRLRYCFYQELPLALQILTDKVTDSKFIDFKFLWPIACPVQICPKNCKLNATEEGAFVLKAFGIKTNVKSSWAPWIRKEIESNLRPQSTYEVYILVLVGNSDKVACSAALRLTVSETTGRQGDALVGPWQLDLRFRCCHICQFWFCC